ncbi:MAG: DUF3618 domain-containing protein [Micromonosporaceae bacterium]
MNHRSGEDPAVAGGWSTESIPDDPELIRADIARTRTALGETVQALSAKADIRARARQGFEGARARLGGASGRAKDHGQPMDGGRPAVVGAVAGAVLAAGLVALLLVLRGRRRR